jgi:hypothetical protein
MTVGGCLGFFCRVDRHNDCGTEQGDSRKSGDKLCFHEHGGLLIENVVKRGSRGYLSAAPPWIN